MESGLSWWFWRFLRRILLDLLQLLKDAGLILWLLYQDFLSCEFSDHWHYGGYYWHTASPQCCRLRRGTGQGTACLGCCYGSVCLHRQSGNGYQSSKTLAVSRLHQNSTLKKTNKEQQSIASVLYSVLRTSNCNSSEVAWSSELDVELDWGLDLDRSGIKFFFALCWIILLLSVQCSAAWPAYHRQTLPVSETKTTHYSNFVEFPSRHAGGSSRMYFEQNVFVGEKTIKLLIRKLEETLLKVLHHFLPYLKGDPKTEASSHTSMSLTQRTVGSKVIEVPLRGSPNKGYCAKITIGLDKVQEASQPHPYTQNLNMYTTSPKCPAVYETYFEFFQFCLLIDTGSANLAVATTAHPDVNEYFNITNVDESFRNLGTRVSVSYTEGEWSGTLASAMISIAGRSEHATAEAHIALIESSENFFIHGAEWEGIMGMAYSALAKPDPSVETFWDALRKAQGMKDVFALQLCPPLDVSNSSTGQRKPGGQLTLGGLGSDGQSYTGAVFHTPIVHEEFYAVEITNISIDGIQVDIPCKEFNNDKTIVDSGTTDVYLPNRAFDSVLRAILKYFQNHPQFDIPGSFWRGSSKLAWSSNNLKFVFDNFPTVHIAFASKDNKSQEFSLAVTPQIYLRKVEGTTEDRLSATCHPVCDFFVFGIKKREKGTIIGGNVMLGFTTVFDREAGQISFAKSTCQYQSKGSVPYITGPYSRDPVDCECHNCSPANQLVIITGALATVTLVLIAISLILAVVLHRRKAKQQSALADNQASSPARQWSCCCKCRSKEDHTLQDEDREQNSSCFGAASALTWIKHTRARFILRRKHRSTVHNASINVTGSVAESVELHTQEISDADAEEINMRLERREGVECETAIDGAEIEDEAEFDIGIGSNQDTVSLFSQVHCQQPSPHHSELITGKTSYIDDSYPKLALSAESPPDQPQGQPQGQLQGQPQDLGPGKESSGVQVSEERQDRNNTCSEATVYVRDKASVEDERESCDHDAMLPSPVFINLNKNKAPRSTTRSTSLFVGLGPSHRPKTTQAKIENDRTKAKRPRTKKGSSNERKRRSKEEEQNLLNNNITGMNDFDLISSSIKSTDSGIGREIEHDSDGSDIEECDNELL